MNQRRIFLLLAVVIAPVILFLACQTQELTSAKLYLQQQNWEEAEEFLKKAEESEPDNPEIPYLLGARIYARQGEYDLMNEAFERSLSISNKFASDIENVRLRHWSEAFNSGAKTYNQALNQQDEKRQQLLEDAVEHFETAATIMPSKPETYGSLATAYLLLDEIDTAKKTFERALENDPDNFNVLFNYGRLLAEEGQNERAIELLQKAREIDPENSSATQLLSNLYIKIGKTEEALDMMQRAIDQDPENPTLYFNKAILHIRLAQSFDENEQQDQRKQQYDQAIQAMETAVSINPDDMEALIRVGELYQELERWEEARDAFEKVLEEQPDNADVMRKLAITIYRLGDQERAQELLEKAKSLQQQGQ
ncbi:MAG TPA: tetratricopeptide repeat protein [bacterium]|nr:tetratricopeptide repeat protein [bacterium]